MEVQTNFIDQLLDQIKFDSNAKAIEDIRSGRMTEKDIINLCGGIPSENITYLNLEIECYVEHVFEVTINTNLHDVSRTLNFSRLFIANDSMTVYNPKRGVGRNLLINQVVSAREKGFKFLYTNAAAHSGIYNGYITWGKLGYTMDSTSMKEFNDLMRNSGRTEKTLFELLQTNDGCDFWRKSECSWAGYFYLTEGDKNISLLKKYLTDRNISVSSL